MIIRLTLLLTLCLSASALAAERWAALPIQAGAGVSPDATATFHELLIAEIGARNGVAFARSEAPCLDVPCALKEGKALGASVVIFGKISKLGRKLIVTTTAVETHRAEQIKPQRMSVDQIEDLEAVAARMAKAIVEGGTTEEAAELGTIAGNEVKPDRRREGYSGLSLRIGGAYPLDDQDHKDFIMMLGVGYWYEARSFAIEPRISYRATNVEDDEPSYEQLHFDVGTHFILTRGDIAPFVGIGGGLRRLETSRYMEATQGSIIPLDSSGMKEDSAWGPGAYVRAGLLLFRTYTMRVALAAEYDVSFIEVHQRSAPQTFNFGISVLF